MINLVLKQLRQVPIVVGAQFAEPALHVLVANVDLPVPFYLHKNRQKTQTRIPYDDLLLATGSNHRIDKRPRLSIRQLKKDHSRVRPYLWRGNGSSITGAGTPV